jgi:hypothetical protein
MLAHNAPPLSVTGKSLSAALMLGAIFLASLLTILLAPLLTILLAPRLAIFLASLLSKFLASGLLRRAHVGPSHPLAATAMLLATTAAALLIAAATALTAATAALLAAATATLLVAAAITRAATAAAMLLVTAATAMPATRTRHRHARRQARKGDCRHTDGQFPLGHADLLGPTNPRAASPVPKRTLPSGHEMANLAAFRGDFA